MTSLKSILPIVASVFVCIEPSISRAQSSSQPEFSVSTNYVAHGERVYLIGKNLDPGLQVVVSDGPQNQPRFWFTADKNGEIYGEITDPNSYDSAQRYQVAYGTDYYFLVRYEDGNPYPWGCLITEVTGSLLNGSTNRTFTLKAEVNPRNTYRPVYAYSLNGPWIPIGKVVPGYLLAVNTATWTFDLPDDLKPKFFRIWRPQEY